MPFLTRSMTAAAVVASAVVVATPALHGQAVPSSALLNSSNAEVAPAVTDTTSALASTATVPDLVPVTPTVESHPVGALRDQANAKTSRLVTSGDEPVVAALSAPEPADGFVVTGVTWSGKAPAGLELDVRTRTDDVWSTWIEMTYDAEHGPTPGSGEASEARPGTDPFVAGNVDDVQLKVRSDNGSLPRGLSLEIVDPGASVAEPTSASAATSKTATTTAAAKAAANTAVTVPTATPRPTINSRSAWGAAEGLRDCCVEYGEIHAAFVHHTVNANNYKAAEVPAILRGIYAYHTQSRGWKDIGYNFLIDRFGRIWEGRYGGVTRPVVGAHTLNYNENAFAASAIGNFETAQPSAAMLDAYARLFAWKLSLHGVEPTTRQKVAGTMFDAISGHRDAASTACPGIHLYRKIPQIIAKTAAYQTSFGGRGIFHTFVGDSRPDILAVSGTTGKVSAVRGTAPPRFGTAKVVRDFPGMDQVVVAGDLTGDGTTDLLARSKATGTTKVFKGSGTGTFTASTVTTKRWAATDLFAAPGDLTGDGQSDVLARDKASRELRLYPGLGRGRFGTPRVAFAHFGTINLLGSAGDFNRDGHRDIVIRGASGVVRVMFGDGTGTFPRSVVVATNWSAASAIAGGVDLTGDGRPDIVARNGTAKTTRIFANIAGSRISSGIGVTRATLGSLSVSTDADGDGVPAIISAVGGRLVLMAAYRQNFFAPTASQGTVMAGAGKVMVVGDWNRDRYVDTMAYETATKKIWFYPGSAGSAPAKNRIGGWSNLAGYRGITAVGDFDGDGWPDLMAKGSNGAIYLFPGRGDAGFAAKVKVRSGLPAGSTMFGLGRWTADGAPDLGVRTTSGNLYVYPGNGPGGLDDPILLGTGFSGYNALFLAGDVTADRRQDLVGRDRLGDLWVLPKRAPSTGRPAGSIGPRLYAGSGLQGYRLN